jgi:hypothetical protein
VPFSTEVETQKTAVILDPNPSGFGALFFIPSGNNNAIKIKRVSDEKFLTHSATWGATGGVFYVQSSTGDKRRISTTTTDDGKLLTSVGPALKNYTDMNPEERQKSLFTISFAAYTGPAPASPPTYRYVRIIRDKDGDNHNMNLAEVEVFSGGTNLASGKTVTQSSISHPGTFDPSNLVDGNKTNFAHTNNEPVEWFLIDLGQDYDIEKVVITNRTDCCQDRLRNTKIQLSKVADMSSPKESRAITTQEAPNAVITWDVKTDIIAPGPTGPAPTDTCVSGSVCPSKLTSTSGTCVAITQDDGNYVVYESGTAIWDSKTTGQGTGPYRTDMQNDGNLVLYDSKDTALWDSKTWGRGTGPYKAIMQDDCNLVIYDSTGSAMWSSKGGPTSPGRVKGWSRVTTGLKNVANIPTPEGCLAEAKKVGSPYWIHRNSTAGAMANSCDIKAWTDVYAGDDSDTAHVSGCTYGGNPQTGCTPWPSVQGHPIAGAVYFTSSAEFQTLNPNDCVTKAKEIGALSWGYRTANHPEAPYKNTCFFYSNFDAGFTGNAEDTAHISGCTNGKSILNKCV